MQQSRPVFHPVPLSDAESLERPALQNTNAEVSWVPVIGCSADFPINIVRTLLVLPT